MVWACDEKSPLFSDEKSPLFSSYCDGNESTVGSKRGRPKRRWLDKVQDDIKEKGLSADELYDRATWRRMSSHMDHT